MNPTKEDSRVVPEERVLIQQAREGNRSAFRILVERHMRQAYDVAYSIVRNHDAADDVTQEAFVRAYRSLATFRGDAAFGTWLYRIVMNLALNRIKSDERRGRHEIRSLGLESLAAPAVDSPENLAPHIERALHALPTMQRAVVMLRHMSGLSTRQVSGILEMSEGTVKTHLFRGLKKMKEELQFLNELEA